MFNENRESDDTDKLFKDLEYHNNMFNEVDKNLFNLCLSKIEFLLNSGKGYKAKEIFRDFYKKDKEDISFEKDLLLMKINKVIKVEDETNKYNL